MLSVSEIKNHEFKRGIGYSKKSVDEFISELAKDYDAVCKENIELRDKATALSEGLQYYKSIEKTLQKALVLAQKASDEEEAKANKRARLIEKTAHTRADEVLTRAKTDLDTIFRQTDDLNRRFELYKAHVKNLITTQLDLINSDAYNISINDLEGYLKMKEMLENAKDINPDEIQKEEMNSQATNPEDKDKKENEAELKSEDNTETKSDVDTSAENTADEETVSKDNLINKIPVEITDDGSTDTDDLKEKVEHETVSKRVPLSRYRNGESENEQNT